MDLHLRLSVSTLLFALALGCSSTEKKGAAGNGAGPAEAGTVAPADQAMLTAPGSYHVATRDFTFVDSSRPTPANGTYAGAPDRTLVTKVWFPSPDGTAVATGPFPVIAYAHGFLSSKLEADALKNHLASHGYVIVAPDFPLSNSGAPGGPTLVDLAHQPGDLAFVVDALSKVTGNDADLAAAMDTSTQGVAGLSLGGGTTLIAVYHPVLNLPKIRAAVAYAPFSCAFAQGMFVHAVPTLILGGSADELVPFDGIATREQAWAPPPLQVAKLVGGTHVGFTNIEIPDAGNSDQIGCGAVTAALGGSSTSVPYAQTLADDLNAGTNGGVAANDCGTVCGQTFTQTMHADRQLELQKAATLAHFEAVLRGKKDAAAYLATSFDEGNDDVEVTRAR